MDCCYTSLQQSRSEFKSHKEYDHARYLHSFSCFCPAVEYTGFAAETPAADQAKLPATPIATTAAVKLNAKDSRAETFQAQVLAVNLKDRLVTLRNQDGESIQLAAGDGVRNLEQLRVGDQVTVHATKSGVLQLKENKGVAQTFVGRKFSLAPEGVKPADTATN